MLIYQNAEGVHGRRKVWKPWSKAISKWTKLRANQLLEKLMSFPAQTDYDVSDHTYSKVHLNYRARESVDEPNTCKTEDAKSESNIYLFIVAGFMIAGIGGTPIQPLGYSYVDDHANEHNSALYLGELKKALTKKLWLSQNLPYLLRYYKAAKPFVLLFYRLFLSWILLFSSFDNKKSHRMILDILPFIASGGSTTRGTFFCICVNWAWIWKIELVWFYLAIIGIATSNNKLVQGLQGIEETGVLLNWSKGVSITLNDFLKVFRKLIMEKPLNDMFSDSWNLK